MCEGASKQTTALGPPRFLKIPGSAPEMQGGEIYKLHSLNYLLWLATRLRSLTPTSL